MECPLPKEKQQYGDFKKLLEDCKSVNCPILGQIEGGGDPCANCLLLVASLLDMPNKGG